MFDGVLFDLDGTLWDSVDSICLSWNRVLGAHDPALAGTLTREKLIGCMGMLLPDIFRKLLPQLPPETLAAMEEELMEAENSWVAVHGGILYPGVEPFSRPTAWGSILPTLKTPAAPARPRRRTSPWWWPATG